jgi:hypothetical protein
MKPIGVLFSSFFANEPKGEISFVFNFPCDIHRDKQELLGYTYISPNLYIEQSGIVFRTHEKTNEKGATA